MIAQSERLSFSALSHEDIEGLYAALAQPAVYRYLGGESVPSAPAFAAQMCTLIAGPRTSDQTVQWRNAVVRLASPEAGPIIGRLEATSYGAWAEVAYLFSPAHWGHGFATEAMQWWHKHLSEVGVRTVWAAVTPGNDASVRLLGRLGYAARPVRDAPVLGSYDEGDLVFSRELVVSPRAE
jgi:RimJ/RimL family protein N-acetyltransferase